MIFLIILFVKIFYFNRSKRVKVEKNENEVDSNTISFK